MKKHKTLIFGILLFGIFFASFNNLLVNAATCSNWSEAEEDRNASGKTYGGRYTEESETLSEVKKYILSQRNISDPCKSQEDKGKMCEEICTGTPTDAEIKQLGGGNFVKPEDTDTEKYSYSRVWGDDTYCYYVVTVQKCTSGPSEEEALPKTSSDEDLAEISCGKAGKAVILDRNKVAGGLLKQNSWTSRNTTVTGEYFQAFVQTKATSSKNAIKGCVYAVNTGTVDKNSPVENGRRSVINQFSTKNNSMIDISDSLMIYQCTTAVTKNSSDCDQSTNEGKTARTIANAIWSVFKDTAKDKIHDQATLDAIVKKLGKTKVSNNIIKNVLSGYAGFKYNADDYENSFEFDVKDRKLNGKTGTATIVVKPKAANAKLSTISFYKGSVQGLSAADKAKQKLTSVEKVANKEYEVTIPNLNENKKDCEKVTVTIELSYLGSTGSYVISYIDTTEGHRYYLALKNSNDVVAASTTEFSFYMSDECDQLIGEENVVCFDGTNSEYAKYKAGKVSGYSLTKYCCGKTEAKSKMGSDFEKVCNVCFDGAASHKAKYKEDPVKYKDLYASCCNREDAKDNMGSDYNTLCNACFDGSGSLKSQYHENPTAVAGAYAGCCTDSNAKEKMGNIVYNRLCNNTVCENDTDENICKEESDNGFIYEVKPTDGEPGSGKGVNNYVCLTEGKDSNGNTYEEFIFKGNPYCSVYCKEDIETYFQGFGYNPRTGLNILSGQYFEFKPFGTQTNLPAINQTRNCVYKTDEGLLNRDIYGKDTADAESTGGLYGQAIEYLRRYYDTLNLIASYEKVQGTINATCEPKSGYVEDTTKDSKITKTTTYTNTITKDVINKYTAQLSPSESGTNYNLKKYNNLVATTTKENLNTFISVYDDTATECALCVKKNVKEKVTFGDKTVEGFWPKCCTGKKEVVYDSAKDGYATFKYDGQSCKSYATMSGYDQNYVTWSVREIIYDVDDAGRKQKVGCLMNLKVLSCLKCGYSEWEESFKEDDIINNISASWEVKASLCHGTYPAKYSSPQSLPVTNELQFDYYVWVPNIVDVTVTEADAPFISTEELEAHYSPNSKVKGRDGRDYTIRSITYNEKNHSVTVHTTTPYISFVVIWPKKTPSSTTVKEDHGKCYIYHEERTCSGVEHRIPGPPDNPCVREWSECKCDSSGKGVQTSTNCKPALSRSCSCGKPNPDCEIKIENKPDLVNHLNWLRKEAADLRERYLRIVAEINRAKDMYQQCVKYGDEKKHAYAESDYPKIDDFWYQEMDIASPEVRKILEKIELERKSLDVGTTDLEYCKGEGGSLKNCSKTSNYTDKTIPILLAELEKIDGFSTFTSYLNAHKISSETIRFYEFAKNEAHANVSYGIGTEMYSLKPSGLTVTKDDPAFKLAEANKTYNRLGFGLPISITTSYGKYDYSFVIANLGKNNRMLKAFEDLNDDSKYTCKYFVTPFIVCPPDGCKLIPTVNCPPGSAFDETCYADGTGTMSDPKLQPYSRQIDTNNINVNDRTLGEPWNTEKGQAAQERIANENLDSQVPMYTFILTPEDIKQIKENTKVNGYSKFEMTCDDNGRCISPFVEEFGEDSIVQAGRKVWIEYVNGKFEIVTD